jgi:predicted HTH domain antitoxin
MTRNEFESELMSRQIDVYRIDEEYLRHELEMSGRTPER